MINSYKKFILIFLVLIGILVSSFFIYKNCFKEKVITKPIKEPIEFLTIDIDGKTLAGEENNFIYSSTLQPEFNIITSKNIDIQSLKLKLDNFENILSDKFYGETVYDETKRMVIFQSSFMLTPEEHELIIEYNNLDGEPLFKNFSFVLSFNEDFKEGLKHSKVWIVPKNRPSDWFNVKDGKLLVKPTTDDLLSSLAFLYTFDKDVTVDFELIPVKNKVSLIFYFLEFGSFTIGSNDNKTVVLIRDNQPDLFGKKFELLTRHRYHVRIVKDDFEYRLAIKELVGDERVDPLAQFLTDSILLEYVGSDLSSQDLIVHNPNHIGFSFWRNSEGISLDDIFITGHSIY